jgi:hypothetical protein
MQKNKTVLIIKRLVPIFFYAAVALLVSYNFIVMSEDMLRGDFSGEKAFPQPLYGFSRIPDRPITLQRQGVDRLAADYAQVYFPSQEFSSLRKNYESGYLDPWKRPSRYAPFIHYVCLLAFCKFDYGMASFLHMIFQMVLFAFFFVGAFKMLGIETNLRFGLSLTGILLFASPVGLAWFERGQFSLYVALSYLLLILGFIKNKPAFIVFSSLFAYVKWTAYPFLFVMWAVFMLGSKNKQKLLRNAQLALLFAAPIVLLSGAFRHEMIPFLKGLYQQELLATPEGISLTQIAPVVLVKCLPAVLILLGYLHLRKAGEALDYLIPYLAGAGTLLLIYPTMTFEYVVPGLFCFIPLVMYWNKLPNLPDNPNASGIILWSFVGFLVLVSYSNYVNRYFNVNLLWLYILIGVGLLMVPLIYPKAFFPSVSQTNRRG